MDAQRQDDRTPRLRITSAPLWFVLPAVLTLMYVWTRVAYPLDFWHHLTSGHLVWLHGSVPKVDTFTYTIGGEPIVDQNWLAQLGLYGLYRCGGFPLAQFVAGLCYAGAILVITRLAWRRCGNVYVASGLGVVAFAMAISNLTVRTQMVSVPLFAVELYALYQWPGRWRTVAVVAGAELLWTNAHGAFPLGVVLPGMFFLAAAWQALSQGSFREGTLRKGALRRIFSDRTTCVYLACVLVAMAVMFCNPHPHKTLDYVFGLVSKASQRAIDEWQPTAAGGHPGIAYAASIAIVLVALGLSRKRLEPVDLLLLVSFAILGNRAQRMVLWWGLVMAAVLAPQVAALLRSWIERREGPAERSMSNLVTLCVLLAASVMFTPWTRQYNPLLPPSKRQEFADDEPRQVVRFLQDAGYRGRVFCPMEWGAYFVWFLKPDVQTFVDARIDFFPDKVWNEYVRVGNGRSGWEEILTKYDVDLVVWNRHWSDTLPQELAKSARWTKVFDDQLSIAFQHIDRGAKLAPKR